MRNAFSGCYLKVCYWRLKDSLDLRWLHKKTKKYYGTEGQKSIDPVVFFKLILIGYLENIGSDRRIMQTAQMRMDMLYFLGYDIDEELARVSVKPGKARQLNYLSQVSVDTASHVITNIEAHLADKKDSQCLPSLRLNS